MKNRCWVKVITRGIFQQADQFQDGPHGALSQSSQVLVEFPVVLAEVVLMRLTPPSAFLAWVWYAFYVQAEFPPCLKVKDGSKGTLYACIIFSKVLL